MAKGAGKGTGKGGCAPGVWEEFDLWVQVLILVSCAIGPALIIAGIVLIATKADNSRTTLIQGYNQAITDFEAPGKAFAQTTFFWGLTPFAANTSAEVLGDSGSFPSYSYIKHQLTVPSSAITAGLSINANKPTNDSIPLPIVDLVDKISINQVALNCHTATIPCSGTNAADCNAKPICSEYCKSLNGVWDETQLICNAVHYLHEICLQVDSSTGAWVLGLGCYWLGRDSASSQGNIDPSLFVWSPAIYAPNQKNFTLVTLRLNSDPYVYASNVTFGTYNFGKSLTELITPGIIVLAVGVGFEILDIAAVLLFVWWSQTSGRGRKGKIRNGGLESAKASKQVEAEDQELLTRTVGKKHAPGHESYEHDIKPITHIIPIYPLDQTPSRTESSPGSN